MRVQSAGEPPAVGNTEDPEDADLTCSHCNYCSPDVRLRHQALGPLVGGRVAAAVPRCPLCNAVWHLWDELRQSRDVPPGLRREIPEELRVASRVLVRRATFYLLSWRLRDSDEEGEY